MESKEHLLRFLDKVDTTGPCWVWRGATGDFGYGLFNVNKVCEKAHRFSYRVFNGEIPEGQFVCHLCDNPSCVNPRHLWIGDAQANAIDRNTKGRAAPCGGENNGFSVLTEEQVRYAKRHYIPRDPMFGASALARKFGVSNSAVGAAIRGQNWGHVT